MKTDTPQRYVARVRKVMFDGMVKAAKKRGLTLSEWFAVLFEEKPLETLAMFSRFLPQETKVEAHTRVSITSEPLPETNNWIEGVATAEPAGEAQKSLPN